MNIKEQLEEVIRKNLPEKKKEMIFDRPLTKGGGCPDFQAISFNQALSQINTSLIADEVLKVVVEILSDKQKLFNFIPQDEYGYKRVKTSDLNILQLLSNLSPNKENKNNE